MNLLSLTALLSIAIFVAPAIAADPLTLADYLQAIKPVKANARIAYGAAPSQWVDLYLPKGAGPCPVVILAHGGCFSARVPAESLGQNAADLAAHGVAVWNIEYRRVGEPGGGYPGMFHDVGAAVDLLRREGAAHNLYIGHVVAVGHSAGGLLALWAAARSRLSPQSPLFVKNPLRIATVVSIAGTGDLRSNADWIALSCRGMSTIDQIVGIASPSRNDPFLDTSPRELLPIGVKTVSITGEYDDNYPPYIALRWRQASVAAGDLATESTISGAGHFDVVAVGSPAWAHVRELILAQIAPIDPGHASTESR